MSKIRLILIVLTVLLFLGNTQVGFGRGGRGGPIVPPFPDAPASGAASQEVIDELVAVLQSPESTLYDKSETLRKLSLVGTRETVSVIAEFLSDEKLSHMARYALEPLDDPSVDVVFRNALGTLEGPQLVGVIISIGARGDTQAVDALAAMLDNSDDEIVQTTALALGLIGDASAAAALRGALADVSSTNEAAFCGGLFRCAESLMQSRRNLAIEIYDELLELDTDNKAISSTALRGAILARQDDGVELMQQYLNDDDQNLLAAAAGAAIDMTAPGTTEALTSSLDRLSNESQVMVIDIIGQRGDITAVPELIEKTQGDDLSVRLAAIKVLPQLPSSSSISFLVDLLGDSNSDITEAAKTAITSMPGEVVDDVILGMLDSSDDNQLLGTIEIIGNRQITSGVPALIELASESSARVRRAALNQVGKLGTPENLDALLEIAIGLDGADLDAAVEAISNLFADASTDSQVYSQQIISRISNAQLAQKTALLRILGITGGDDALTTVCDSLSDTNNDVRIAAIESLSDWTDFSAAQHLYEVAAESSSSLQDHVLSLRGVADLVRECTEADQSRRTGLCLAAYDATRRNEERMYLISAMGYLRSIEAGNKLVEIATENEELREEAAAALIKVATSLYTGQITTAAAERAAQETSRVATGTDSPISFGRNLNLFGGDQQTVNPTEEEMSAAQAMGQSILDLNISESINTSAQNIASGNLGRRVRGRGR